MARDGIPGFVGVTMSPESVSPAFRSADEPRICSAQISEKIRPKQFDLDGNSLIFIGVGTKNLEQSKRLNARFRPTPACRLRLEAVVTSGGSN
jgi:hypothetical protein